MEGMTHSKGPRSRKVACWIGIPVLTFGFLVAGSTYDRLYRIPSGPALPPQPADRTFSEQVVTLNNRAAKIHLESPESALRLYDEALTADPAYHPALASKAQLLVQRKEYGEALACYNKLNALRPRVAEYYVGGAFCLWRSGDRDRAEDYLLKALSAYRYNLEDSPFYSRFNRSLVLFLLGRERVARRELDSLEKEHTGRVSQTMILHLRQAMDEHENKDPWLLITEDAGKDMAVDGPANKNPRIPVSEDAGEDTWICSMHPQIHLPKSGKCPLCGMEMVEVEDVDGGTVVVPEPMQPEEGTNKP